MLQRIFRGWKARKYATQIRINTISVWLAARVLHYWCRQKTLNTLKDIQLEKQHQWIATVCDNVGIQFFKVIIYFFLHGKNETGTHTKHVANALGQWSCQTEEIRIFTKSEDIESNT